MSELTPITRIESYLDAIVNSGTPPLEDITRIETFLQAIYDNQVCALTPITRIEMFLGKISGQDIVLPEPITRIELYLAAIAGEDVELPEEPITRIEMYLSDWADSGDWTTISGAIVEFITQRAHKLKSCVVSISPIQDLSHGDPSPTNICPISGWDGVTVYDTGKNLLGIELTDYWLSTTTGLPEETTGYSVSGFIKVKANEPVAISKTGSSRRWFYDKYKNPKQYLSYSDQQIYTPTEDGYLRITVNSQYYDSAYAVYGSSYLEDYEEYKGKQVSVTFDVAVGKNLYDPAETEQNKWVSDQGVVDQNGYWLSGYILLKANQPYTRSQTGSGRCAYFDLDKNFKEYFVDYSLTVTPTEDCYLRFVGNESTYPSDGEIQFERGSSATPYEPYTHTAYGGTVDLVSGVLTIDRAKLTNEFLASNDARYDGAGRGVFVLVQASANLPTYPATTVDTTLIATALPTSSQNDLYNNNKTGIAHWWSNRIGFSTGDSNITTPADFRQWLADNGSDVVYPLATPITVQLTPQQITALKGYNAMWSNAGDLEVTVHGTSVELSTQQALNMLLGGAYHNNQTADDVSDDEALDIILGGENR